MSKLFFLIIPNGRKATVINRDDLSGIHSFLFEHTSKTDPTSALEELGATVAIEHGTALALEAEGYKRGYRQACLDQRWPDHARVLQEMEAPDESQKELSHA